MPTLTPAVTTTTGCIPGRAITKPVSAVQRGRHSRSRGSTSRRRSTGTYTYIQNVRVPGMVHGRSVRPRGAGANTSQNHYAAQRRPDLDRAHPGRAGRPDRQLPRRRRAEGVRRDPGRRSAEGRLEERPEVPGGSGNYWSWLRQAGDTNTVNPARCTADTGASRRRWRRRRRPSRRPTATTTTTSCRSARTARSPTSRRNPSDPTQNSATIYFCAQGRPASGMGAGGGSTTPISTILAALPNSINIPQNQVRLIWYEGSGSYGGGQTRRPPRRPR